MQPSSSEPQPLSFADWQKIVSAASKASDKETHGYIVTEGGTIKTVTQLTPGCEKLSISEIVAKTEQLLKDTPTASPDQKSTVVEAVKKISDRKSAKMNTFSKRVGRTCLSCLKIASYASIIGIPAGLYIRRLENTYINPHMAEIKNADQLYKSYYEPLMNVAKASETTKILKLSHRALQEQINDEIHKRVTPDGMLAQFQKDHTRSGIFFTIKDGKESYLSPIRLQHHDRNQHLQRVYQGVRQAIREKPEDQKWFGPLQAVLTQTSLTSTIVDIIGRYATTDWENTPYQDHTVLIQQKSRRIAVEIVRKDGYIQALKVSTTIQSNMTADEKPFATLTTQCTFNLTLDKDNNPVVDSFKVTHTPTLGVV